MLVNISIKILSLQPRDCYVTGQVIGLQTTLKLYFIQDTFFPKKNLAGENCS